MAVMTDCPSSPSLDGWNRRNRNRIDCRKIIASQLAASGGQQSAVARSMVAGDESILHGAIGVSCRVGCLNWMESSVEAGPYMTRLPADFMQKWKTMRENKENAGPLCHLAMGADRRLVGSELL
jgi:hypothetical protein